MLDWKEIYESENIIVSNVIGKANFVKWFIDDDDVVYHTPRPTLTKFSVVRA